MKLLFITDNFPPEVNAPATRTYEHCCEWLERGVDVTVITCAPNFPQGELYQGYRNKLFQKEVINGIKVIRVWSYISPNKGFIKRIADYLSFAITAFFASLFVKTDVIIATSPQFFSAVCGYFASIFKRTPWLMEVRDLWPESIKAVNAMKRNSKILDFMEKVELFLYRKARSIIVVTDSFKENIANRGIDPDKIWVVKNGVYTKKFPPIPKDKELLAELKLEDNFVIGYLGTHGMAHKLDFILKSAAKVNGNIHFLFIGDGAEKQGLLELKEKMGLSNTTMLPFVSKEEVKRYISVTDVALVPLKKSDTFKTVIPSKIFENASMRKPILLGVEGESKGIVEKYKAGLCFEPENEADFLEKLNLIYKDKELYDKLMDGCVELAKDYDRGFLAHKMLDIIVDSVNTKTRT